MSVGFKSFAFSASLSREIAPKSHRLWQSENEDIITGLQSLFTAWLNDVSEKESLFKKHVYEAEDLHDMDLRQHRSCLYQLLHDGEELAFLYLHFGFASGKIGDIKPTVAVIDQKIKELFGVLLEWHGPLAGQTDIPESFKEAVKEVDEGKFVDLEFPHNGGKK